MLLAFGAGKHQRPLGGGPSPLPRAPGLPAAAPRYPSFLLRMAVVSGCNYSLTFLPTVIPNPVSSYFPKGPLKSTFSTFQIGRDREKMCVFLPRL